MATKNPSAVRDAQLFTKRKVVVRKTVSHAGFDNRTEGGDAGGGGPSDGLGVSENDIEIQSQDEATPIGINGQSTPVPSNDPESTHPHRTSDTNFGTLLSLIPSWLIIGIGLEDEPPSQLERIHEEVEEGNCKETKLNFTKS